MLKEKAFTSLGLALIFMSLSSCNYSNTFTGTFNGTPATLNAYSRNINKYCIALTLTSGSITQSLSVSAQDMFDSSSMLADHTFNTKTSTTGCGSAMTDYLEGTRAVKVLGTSEVRDTIQLSYDRCQVVYYKQIEYQEHLTFSLKQISDDSVMGSFDGMGQVSYYVDDSAPTRYGSTYYCGERFHYGYPGYPYPYPWYPYPW